MVEPNESDRAWRYLRAHSRGELGFDERISPVRYITDRRGKLVWPASTQMLDAVDCVLFVPENIDGAMEVQVTLERLDPDGVLGALTDRWRIYHGDPEEGAWAIADIDAARHDGSVYDGLAMQRENSLADREPGLCRMVNTTHRDGLRALCERLAGVDATAPLLVGVDPCGLDVRRRFDIVRLPIEPPIENAETAEERLLALLGGEGPDT